MRIIRTLHTVVAWISVLVFTVVFGSTAVILGLLFPRSDLALRAARGWGRMCLLVAGCRLTIEGLENIDLGANYVVMANHESTLDIPTLLVALPQQLGVRFLAKKSLFSVPFLGRAMHAMRFIPVNREDGSTAKDMFEQSLRQLGLGRSVLIFPEATRTPDGHLLPFQRGGFLLAIKSGAAILPVGLEGPRLAMTDGAVSVRPEHIVVRFGKAITTTDYGISRRKELTGHCRRVIDELRGARGHHPDQPRPAEKEEPDPPAVAEDRAPGLGLSASG